MELQPVVCPKCGGTIQAPVEEETCFCTFCGTQLYIDNGLRTVTYRTVDEARIKEADAQEKIRLKELEILGEKESARRLVMKIGLAVGVAMTVVGWIGKSFAGSEFFYLELIGMTVLLLVFSLLMDWFRSGNDDADD